MAEQLEYYQLPEYSGFDQRVKEAGSTTSLVGKFIGGFIEGFTTLPINEEPENTAEAIAENLGHLLGFIGVVPGLGTVGSMGAKAIMGTGRFAAKAAVKTVGSVAGASTTLRAGRRVMGAFGRGAVPVARFRSVPMWAADKVTKKAFEIAGKGAAGTRAAKFLNESELAGHLLHGAFHLGTASAVSSWTKGVDDMAHSFAFGAVAGGVFRGIGSIPGISHQATAEAIRRGQLTPNLSVLFGGGENAKRMAARMMAGTVFQGLPSTMAGAPIEMQIYDYLLGAYFGGMEVSHHERSAMNFVQERRGHTHDRMSLMGLAAHAPDGTRQPVGKFKEEFEGLSPEAQEMVITQVMHEYGKMFDTGKEAFGVTSNIGLALQKALLERYQTLVKEGRMTEEEFHNAWIEYLGRAGAELASRYSIEELFNMDVPLGEERQLPPRSTTMDDMPPGGFDAAKGPDRRAAQDAYERMKEIQLRLNELEQMSQEDPEFRTSKEGRFNYHRLYRGYEKLYEQFTEAGGFGMEAGGPDIPQTIAETYQISPEAARADAPKPDPPKPERPRTAEEAVIEGAVYDVLLRPIDPAFVRANNDNTTGDHELPTSLEAPLTRVADYMVGRKWNVADENGNRKTSSDISEEIIEMAQLTFLAPGGKENFPEFVRAFQEKYGEGELKKDSDPYKDLIKVWNETSGLMKQYLSYVRVKEAQDGSFYVDVRSYREPRSLDGELLRDQRNVSHGEKSLGELLGILPGEGGRGMRVRTALEHEYLSNLEVMSRKGVKAGLVEKLKMHDSEGLLATERPEYLLGFLKQLDGKGFMMAAGVKDKGRLVMHEAPIKSHTQALQIVQGARQAFRDFWDRHRKADEIDPDTQFEFNLKKWVGLFETYSPQTSREDAESLFYRYYANNIKVYEALNGGKPLAEILEDMGSLKGQYVLDPIAFNKRMQIIDSAEYELARWPFTDIEDFSDGFRVVVAKHNNATDADGNVTGKRPVEGLIRSVFTYEVINPQTGEIKTKVHDAHHDGPFVLRRDIYDALASFGGWGEGTGSQKGFVRFANRKEGMFLGKLQFARATTEMDKEMHRYGLHGIMMDSAAKQRGSRPVVEMTYDPANKRLKFYGQGDPEAKGADRYGKEWFSDKPLEKVDSAAFTVPVDGMTLSRGTGESVDKNLSIQRLFMQLHGKHNLYQSGNEAMVAYYDKFVEGNWFGDMMANDLARQFYREDIESPDVSRLKEFHTDDLAPQLVVDIVQNSAHDSPLYKKVVNDILKKSAEEAEMHIMSDDTAGQEKDLADITNSKSHAQILLEEFPTAPWVMDHPSVHNHWQTVFRNYIRDRMIRPKVRESFKSIGLHYAPEYIAQYNLQPGEFMLASSAREAKVRDRAGNQMTLGKLYDEYQMLSRDDPAEMSRHLNNIVGSWRLERGAEERWQSWVESVKAGKHPPEPWKIEAAKKRWIVEDIRNNLSKLTALEKFLFFEKYGPFIEDTEAMVRPIPTSKMEGRDPADNMAPEYQVYRDALGLGELNALGFKDKSEFNMLLALTIPETTDRINWANAGAKGHARLAQAGRWKRWGEGRDRSAIEIFGDALVLTVKNYEQWSDLEFRAMLALEVGYAESREAQGEFDQLYLSSYGVKERMELWRGILRGARTKTPEERKKARMQFMAVILRHEAEHVRRKDSFRSLLKATEDIPSSATVEYRADQASKEILPVIDRLMRNPKRAFLNMHEEALDWAVIRAPSDSLSGTRLMRFKGFVDNVGTGIVLHPMDMIYLGGMDLDIDSTVNYQALALPDKFVDAIRRNQWEWNLDGDKHKPLIESKTLRAGFVKKFTEDEALRRTHEEMFPEMEVTEDRLSQFYKSAWSTFDPLVRFQVSQESTRGNNLLGGMLNATNRAHLLHQMINTKYVEELEDHYVAGQEDYFGSPQMTPVFGRVFKEKFMEFGQSMEKGRTYFMGFKARNDEGYFIRQVQRDAVNFAADAADEIGLVSLEQAKALAGRAAFENVNLYSKDRSGRVRKENIRHEGLKRWLQEHGWEYMQPAKDLAQLGRLVEGRTYDGRVMGFREVTEGIGRLPEWLLGVPNTRWSAAALMGQLKNHRLVWEDVNEAGDKFIRTPWLGKQYSKALVEINRQMQNPGVANMLAGVLELEASPGGKGGATRYATLVKMREALEKIDPKREPKRFREGLQAIKLKEKEVLDYAFRDVYTTASAFVVLDAALRLPGTKREKLRRANEITRQVTRFREEGRQMSGLNTEKRAEALASGARQELKKRIGEYYDSLTTGEKWLFDTAYLSGLYGTRGKHGNNNRFFNLKLDAQAAELGIINRYALKEYGRAMGRVLQATRTGELTREDQQLISLADDIYHDRIVETVVPEAKPGLNEGANSRTVAEDLVNKLWSDLTGLPLNMTRREQIERERDPFFDSPFPYEEYTPEKWWPKVTKELGIDPEMASKWPPKKRSPQKGSEPPRGDDLTGDATLGASPGMTAEMRKLKAKLDAYFQADRSLTQYQAELVDIVADLFYYNPALRKNFNESFRGLTGEMRQRIGESDTASDLSGASIYDLIDFLNYFDIRPKNGGRMGPSHWMRDMEQRKEEGKPLERKHYYWFPESVARDMRPFDAISYQLKDQPVTRVLEDGTVDIEAMNTRVLFSTGDFVWRINDQAVRYADEVVNGLERKLADRFGHLVKDEDSVNLFRVAVAEREAILSEVLGHDVYNRHAETATEIVAEMERRGRKFEVEGKTYTPRELADMIKEEQTAWAREFKDTWVANDEGERRYMVYDEHGILDLYRTFQRMADPLLEGKTRDMPIIGWRGLKKLIWQMKIDKVEVRDPDTGEVTSIGQMAPAQRAEAINILLSEKPHLRFKDHEPSSIEPENYWPHNNIPRWYFVQMRKQKVREWKEQGLSDEEVARRARELTEKYEYGKLSDGGTGHEAARLVILDGGISFYETPQRTGRSTDSQIADDIEKVGLKYTPGHLRMRNGQGDPEPLEGYDMTSRAMETYQRQIVKGYWNTLAAAYSNRVIDKMEARRPFGEYTKNWARFLRIYARDNLGAPSLFPRDWLSDPNQKLQGHPYYWMTDQFWSDSADRIGKFWFGNKIGTGDKKLDAMRISKFSNWEGKYELLSLLSHTKSYINNMVGGSLNTLISTGFEPFRLANNLDYLQKWVNPEWKSWEDVWRDVDVHGGVESFLIGELNRHFSGIKNSGEFIREVVGALKENPMMKDNEIWLIASKYDIPQRVFETGAQFMRASERRLRRRAWLAHYIKARQVIEPLGGNATYLKDANGKSQWDHPWLVQMANRGVKATQFLYNNANRPAFARTSMGRVASRFKLWAMRSYTFRRDLAKAAVAHGFKPGTQGYERAQRMLLVDTMVFGLASLLPYSMFDAALAPPFAELQEMSAFLFGDDKDKERAFYGTLPYPLNITQVITPPIARVPEAMIGAMFDRSMSRLVDYHIWTWAPFGRIGRDLKKTYENPMQGPERMFGFPLRNIHKFVREERQAEPGTYPSPFGAHKWDWAPPT